MQTFKSFLTEDADNLRKLKPYFYKIGAPQITKAMKLYRGVSETSGGNAARYGKGLYTTTSKKHAAEFGKVMDMDITKDIPRNPIIFRSEGDFDMLEQTIIYDIIKAKRRSEVTMGMSDLIKTYVDPNIDGVQVGIGAGAYFVKWPS